MPACDHDDKFFTPGLGCVPCIEDCLQCANEKTCSTCMTPNFGSTPSSCEVKSGSIYTSRDFTSSQTIQIHGAFNSYSYMAVVADHSEFKHNTFYFYNAQGNAARIYKVLKFSKITNSMGTVTIPPISVPSDRTVSIHFIKIASESANKRWTYTGYKEWTLFSWPLNKEVVQYDTVNNWQIDFSKTNGKGLPGTINDYPTIIASMVFEPQYTNKATCKLSLSFYGVLRQVLVNGDPVFYDAAYPYSSDPSNPSVTTREFTKEAGELIMVTIVGEMLEILSIGITGCKDMSDNVVTSSVTKYQIMGADLSSSHFPIAKSFDCGPFCSSCLSSTQCIECNPGYYLLNGECVTKCSGNSKFHSIGTCDNHIRKLGKVRTTPLFNITTQKMEFNLHRLQQNEEIVAIAYPSSFSDTPAHLWVIDDNGIFSLAESYAALYNITPETNLDLNWPVAYQLADSYYDATVAVYTVKRNHVLILNYSTSQRDITTKVNPIDFSYMHGLDLTFDPTFSYDIYYLIDCKTSCQMTVFSDGYVSILKNERTELFNAFFESTMGPYTISRNLSGVHTYKITVSQASFINIRFTGEYYLLTYKHPVTFATHPDLFPSTLPFISANSTTCRNFNSETGECLSCNAGYFLLPDNTCGKCPTGYYGLVGEDICIPSTTPCSSYNFTLVTEAELCVPSCPSGQFYDQYLGCTNCHPDCSSCFGPNNDTCLSCRSPKWFNSTDFTCFCPPGATMDSSGLCRSASSLQVIVPTESLSCKDLLLTANMSQAERDAYSITFTWRLASTTENSSVADNINAYLVTQTARSIIIPATYLSRGHTYNFTAQYTSILNETIINWAETKTVLDYYPDVAIDGGPNQQIKYYQNTTIKLFVTYSSCLTLAYPLESNWTNIGGESLNMTQIFNPLIPLWIKIPKCTLRPNQMTQLKASVWLTGKPNYFTDKEVTLTAEYEQFSVTIIGGNKLHPAGVDLELIGEISYEGECPQEPGIIEYKWDCKITSSGIDTQCPGITGLFQTDPMLIIPASYLKTDDTISLILWAQKNGITVSSTGIVRIGTGNIIEMKIICDNCVR